MSAEDLTVGQTLRNTALRLGSKTALVGMGERITFAQLDQEVDGIAAGLLACGVRRGDPVALWVANTPDWVRAWMATARIGAVLVPINTRYKAEEAAFILRQSDAKVLIMMDEMWSIDYLTLLGAICPDLHRTDDGCVSTSALPSLQTLVVLGRRTPPAALSMHDLVSKGESAHARLAAVEAAVHVDDPLIIVYTSGTTGHPKGAVHSHIALKNAYNIARTLEVSEPDVILGHMPFYHVAGAFSALLPAVGLGCTLVIVPHWEPAVALRLIEEERISYISGIPTHFIDLVEAMRRAPADTSSLRTAWIGGAVVTREVVESVINELKLPSIQAVYGMTETTSSTTLSGYGAPLEVVCENKGRPIGEFEVKIVDPATGLSLPADQIGEVWVRGHIVMLGYYKNPEATREVMTADGWFKTGDLGLFDGDGYLQITGRAKEMFIVGGSNAYPAEIERVLQSHPHVKLAVVVGAPDRRLGEVGFAFIQTAENASVDADEIRAYCKARMADYKVPRYISFLQDFPRTTTGKIQRSPLAQAACDQVKQATLAEGR